MAGANPVDTADTRSQAARLAHDAATQLRRLRPERSRAENRAHAVRAAIATEEVLRLLRGASSGRAAILEILQDAAPETVPSNVLRHASGIQEFARRVRELRDDGYDIRATGDGYRLIVHGVHPTPTQPTTAS